MLKLSNCRKVALCHPALVPKPFCCTCSRVWQTKPRGLHRALSVHSLKLFAFLVAIDEYNSDKIPNLRGCVTDAFSVRQYLIDCLRVPPSHIHVLMNSGATRLAILNGFRDYLIQNDGITHDDAILFYFAGHGSQAAAPEGWASDSRMVETICPHDETAGIEERPAVSGIPDRTLWALLHELVTARHTTNITTILDCCHSGSDIRGGPGTVRGYEKSMAIPVGLDRQIWGFVDELQFQATIPSGFLYRNIPHVLITACRQDQRAYEIRTEGGSTRGVFTQAFIAALRRASVAKVTPTCAGLLDQLPPLPGQDPQCEGDNKNALLFSTSVPQDGRRFFTVDKANDGHVTVCAGYAQGVVPGTEFQLYSHTTSASPLGVLYATFVSITSSTLSPLSHTSSFNVPGRSYALVSRWNNCDAQLKVFIKDPATSATLREIVSRMSVDDHAPRDDIMWTSTSSGADVVLHDEGLGVELDRTDGLVGGHGNRHLHAKIDADPDHIFRVLQSAAHFKFHLLQGRKRNVLDGLVTIELYQLREPDDTTYRYTHKEPNLFRDGHARIILSNEPHGIIIRNDSDYDLFPSLFYFDPSDYSILPWYLPPLNIRSAPLGRRSWLTVGHGNQDAQVIKFTLRPDERSDTGFLVLYLSTQFAHMAHVQQDGVFGAPRGLQVGTGRATPKPDAEILGSVLAVVTVARTNGDFEAKAAPSPTLHPQSIPFSYDTLRSLLGRVKSVFSYFFLAWI